MHELLKLICTLPDFAADPKVYKDAWRKIGAELVAMHTQFTETWNLIIGSVPGLDDLLPLYIAFTPTLDRELLSTAKQKLEIAISCNLDDNPDKKELIDLDIASLQCYTHLYASVSYILLPDELKVTTSPQQKLREEKEELKLQRVIESLPIELPIIKKIREEKVLQDTEKEHGLVEKNKLKNLIEACKSYRQSLEEQLDQFEKRLLQEPEKFALIHDKYFKDPNKPKEKIFLQINDDVLLGKFPFANDSPETLMVKQYLCQLDIYYTLVRHDNPTHRATEFGLKMDNLRQYQPQNPQESSFVKALKYTSNFMGVYVLPANRFFTVEPEKKFSILGSFFQPQKIAAPKETTNENKKPEQKPLSLSSG